MSNNEISFIDTCLYIDTQNKLEIKQHRKPMASEVLIGLLMGKLTGPIILHQLLKTLITHSII